MDRVSDMVIDAFELTPHCPGIILYSDSQLVVKHINGSYVAHDERMATYLALIETRMREFTRRKKVSHLPRIEKKTSMLTL